MSREQLPPLDPALASLLDVERAAAGPTPASLERVWSRVAASLAAPASVDRAPPGGTPGWSASSAAGLAAAAFVTGGIAGAAATRALEPPPRERIVYAERTAPAPAASASVAPTAPSAALPPALAPSLAPAAHAPARATASTTGSSLAEERTILDDARGQLAAGEASRALARTDAHLRAFTRPQLAEEREAIAVQALVALGRGGEARARAERLRASAPNSLFLPAIEDSLRSIP